LPDSDIDILIVQQSENKINEENSEIEKDKISEIIKKIYNILFDTKNFTYIEMIKAKVPIIKCTLKETEVNVDISFFRKNGADAVKTIEKIIDIFPEIRPLTLVIKYTLRQRQLNEIYKGGISSFIIFSLIYYYMSDVRKKILDDIKNGKKEGELTLGHLLVGFFNFYGFMFNYDELGISIRSGCFLYKRKEHKPNTLSIENFQDINQDMGKNCYNFKKVVETFRNARDSLYYPENSPVISYLSGFILPDDILKKRAENL
jgi:non-canonical poly(A) RNA polymerase PAPD5/7